jgi:hypothetical protein
MTQSTAKRAAAKRDTDVTDLLKTVGTASSKAALWRKHKVWQKIPAVVG